MDDLGTDHNNTGQLASAFIRDLVPGRFSVQEIRPPAFSESSFDEVFQDIEIKRPIRLPETKDQQPETETDKKRFPEQKEAESPAQQVFLREDHPASQKTSLQAALTDSASTNEETAYTGAKETRVGSKNHLENQISDDHVSFSQSSPKNSATAEGGEAKTVSVSGTLEDTNIVQKLKTPSTEQAEDRVNDTERPIAVPRALEKAAEQLMKPVPQSRQAEADAHQFTDLKQLIASTLLEKQREISGRSPGQGLPTQQLSSAGLEKTAPAPGASGAGFSILHGPALEQVLASETGQQDGTGQERGSFGQSAALYAGELESITGGTGVEKAAGAFREMLDAGRAILDEHGVLRQVAQALRSWRLGQKDPIRFILEPKHLGTLEIDVILQDGGVKAHMLTADPKVKALLEGNQVYLENALKDQGFQMSHFSVDVGDRGGMLKQERQTSAFTPAFNHTLEQGTEEAPVRPSLSRNISGNGLSLYV